MEIPCPKIKLITFIQELIVIPRVFHKVDEANKIIKHIDPIYIFCT